MNSTKEAKSSFQGMLGQYKTIITEDNSQTLWSQAFDENCHSMAGAKAETLYNFVQGCQILERLELFNELSIFEVGLGLGIGYQITIDSLQDKKVSGQFVSTELDPTLIEWVKENTFHKNSTYPEFNELVKKESNGLVYYQATKNDFDLIILQGDARQTLSKAFELQLIKPVWAIYQDAFSPKKNPTLWTHQWFSQLKMISNSKAILSTYSASVGVRKALLKAGWKIHKREGIGKKRSCTWASCDGESDSQLVQELASSSIDALSDMA